MKYKYAMRYGNGYLGAITKRSPNKIRVVKVATKWFDSEEELLKYYKSYASMGYIEKRKVKEQVI